MQYYNPDNNSSRRWAWLAAGLYGALLAATRRIFLSDKVPLETKIRRFEQFTADTRFYREYYFQLNDLATTLAIRYPDDPGVTELYASHLIASGELEQALALYKLRLADRPPAEKFFRTVIDIESYLQRPDSVDKYVHAALALFPDRVDFHMSKGHVMSYSKQYDKALDAYNAKTGYEIPIHVDAASGGFILPFLNPDTKWDFRLKWVLSISTSGHKFGLVYPGLGWVVWKDKKYLPDAMSFSVNYLGANITQVGLNFSRPAAQILGQYYQFIRLGFEGYKAIQYNSMEITKYIHSEIAKMAPFVNYSDDVVNPLFIWYMKPEYAKNAKWTLYDLQAKLQQSGWMVPAYTLPENIQNYVVMRVVVRQGFSRDMADMLLNDIKNAICEFEKLEYPTPTRIAQDKNIAVKGTVFTHNAHSNAAKK